MIVALNLYLLYQIFAGEVEPMFKHLLVPLDGSHLAEAALPAAAYLAEHLGASITLIHIIERDVSGEIHGDHHLTTPDEAHAYLEAVAGRSVPG